MQAQRILRRPKVIELTGLSRSTIYGAGTFPKAVLLTAKSVGWLESEIIEWQQARIAERDRKRRSPKAKAA